MEHYLPKSCFYYLKDNVIVKDDDISNLPLCDERSIIWVNLNGATTQEVQMVEEALNINVLEPHEIEEIEITSRFINKEYYFTINSYVAQEENDILKTKTVSMTVKGNVLVTFRDADMPLFRIIGRKIKNRAFSVRSGRDLFFLIYETKVDLDADYIESLSRDVTTLVRALTVQQGNYEKLLKSVSHLLETCLMMRDVIEDGEKGLYALMRTDFLNEHERERCSRIINDMLSLMEHLSFLITRLEYLQNTVLGMINLQMNDIIKIFTVVTVLFLPPTLIASIYGMNLVVLPLAEEKWAFWFFLGIMLLSMIAPVIWMKKKRWL